MRGKNKLERKDEEEGGEMKKGGIRRQPFNSSATDAAKNYSGSGRMPASVTALHIVMIITRAK